jgi:hypothetical protein
LSNLAKDQVANVMGVTVTKAPNWSDEHQTGWMSAASIFLVPAHTTQYQLWLHEHDLVTHIFKGDVSSNQPIDMMRP